MIQNMDMYSYYPIWDMGIINTMKIVKIITHNLKHYMKYIHFTPKIMFRFNLNFIFTTLIPSYTTKISVILETLVKHRNSSVTHKTTDRQTLNTLNQ